VSKLQQPSIPEAHNDRRDDLEAIRHDPDALSNMIHQRCYVPVSDAFEQEAKTFLLLLRHCLFYDPDRRMTASAALKHLAVLLKPVNQTFECKDLRTLLRDGYGRKEAVSKLELYREFAEAVGARVAIE
jgi:serine/threonine protein kinase